MTQQLEDVMTDLNLDLAHKAEQLTGFTEQPGMVYALGGCFTGRQGVIIGTPEFPGRTYYVAGWGMLGRGDGDVPDYRHPATAGWLLEMLDKDAAMVVMGQGDGVWRFYRTLEQSRRQGLPPGGEACATLGEACIRAAIARGGWGVR